MPNTPLLIHVHETEQKKKLSDYLKIRARREGFIKDAKGLDNASAVALEWLRDSKTSKNSRIKKIEDVRGYIPGKMYVFDYPDPLYPMEPYDQKPVVICLGETGRDSARLMAGFTGRYYREYLTKPGYMIGININFIPEPIKPHFLQGWVDFFKPQLMMQFQSPRGLNVERQTALQFKYSDLFSLEKTFFFSYAIRMYYLPGINNGTELTYENWYLASCIIPRSFKGTNLSQIGEGYREYIRNKIIKYNS